MCPWDMDAPPQQTGNWIIYDRPEKGRNGTTHPDNDSEQISSQSNIHKPRNILCKLTDKCKYASKDRCG